MNRTLYEVGKPFPGPVARQEGSALAVHQGDGSLHMVCCIDQPTDDEVQAFKGAWELRVYAGPDMPGGLVLLGMLQGSGRRWVHELPFDAALEAAGRLDAMLKRLAGEPTDLWAFLVDRRTRILKTQRLRGLPQAFLDRIAELWGSQPGHGDYYQAYVRLAQGKTSEQIWEAAEPFDI